MVENVLPRRRVLDVQPLTDSLRNANFRIHLDYTPELILLRIYEHDDRSVKRSAFFGWSALQFPCRK